MKKLPFITLLLALPLATTAGAKGIDPTSLPLNTDIEPDLSQAGFIELFNGKDLSGWTMRGGQMIFEAKDGAIIGTTVKGQPNSFLCTDANYSDFIFTSEFKWEVLGNSGIMFRAGTKPPDEKGFERVFGYQSEMDNKDRRYTGGIYGEAMGGWKYPLSKPKEHAAARAAIVDHMAWNRVTIYAKGNEIKTWINGVPCSNLVNDERSEGFFGLQVHSGAQGTIHWRNIKLKDLSDAPQAVDLFASGDFSAWSKTNGEPVGPQWSIQDGVIHRSERHGDIITKEQYKDFDLSFEFKISEAGNSGVKYRTRKSLGLEYQILDDKNHKDRKHKSHTTSGLYDLVDPADNKIYKPAGEWNTGRIQVQDSLITHWLNGEKTLSIKHGSEEWTRAFSKSKYKEHEGFGSWEGPILLQDHNDKVWYRKLRIIKL